MGFKVVSEQRRVHTPSAARAYLLGVVNTTLRRPSWQLAALIAALVIPAVLLAVQRPSAAGSTLLTIFNGTASVAHGPTDFALASDGDILKAGDRVRTDDAGHALVTFFDGSTLELEPATTIQIDVVASNTDGSIAIELSQAIGRTWASVQKLTRIESKFEIKTPTSTASVRGTAFLTEVLPNGETRLHTTEGTVAVTAQGTTVLVTAGLTTTVRPNAAPTAPTSAPSPANLLRFGMHSPAHVVVVDPLGRSCGIAMPGERIVREIPGCDVSTPGSEPELIDVPDAVTGNYRAIITSIEPGGAFTFTTTGMDASGDVAFDYARAGDGQPGAVFGSSLDLVVAADGRMSTSGLTALMLLQSASPSPSTAADSTIPSPTPLSSPAPASSMIPSLVLPSLPVATASPSPSPSSTTESSPEPEPSPTDAPAATLAPDVTPVTTPTPSLTPTATPPSTSTVAPTASPIPTATAAPTPTPAPPPTVSPSRTPVPGCEPSNQRPGTCTQSPGTTSTRQ